jgi:starch synthase
MSPKIRRIMGDLGEFEKNLDDYETKYIQDSTQEHKEEWNKLRSNLDEIVSSHMAPYGYKHLELPVILLATPEIVSLPKNMGNLANVLGTVDGGGLSDISAALIAELDRQGLNIHAILPEYENMTLDINHITQEYYNSLKRDITDFSRIHLVSDYEFANAMKVYEDPNKNMRRAMAFTKGIISLIPELKEKYGNVLVHSNDWMTGLVPAATKSMNVRSLMTFHNIFTQHMTPERLHDYDVDVRPFWRELYFLEHPGIYGNTFRGNYETNHVDFMTSGLHAADMINTVSPTFLKELVNDYFEDHNIMPNHMRDVIKTRYSLGDARGILNAPVESADPRKDPALIQNYWYRPMACGDIVDVRNGKSANKIHIQKKLGLEENLEKPLFFWPSRIAHPQKGFDLLLKVIPVLVSKYPEVQIAVIANGDSELVNNYTALAKNLPNNVAYLPFDRDLSQEAKAGSDFILMPSLYEPCGTPQVEGPRYGTLPIVRRTGGLADTVDSLSGNGLIGNGFKFDDFDSDALRYGFEEALKFYAKGPDFRTKVQKRVMKESFDKFNIENTARSYIDMYQDILRRDSPNIKVQ